MHPGAEQTGVSGSSKPRPLALLCRVGVIVCALPLEQVSETMRPLPVAAVNGMPSFMDGVAVVRGSPVPVVDLARLLGRPDDEPRARFVVVKVDQRYVALAVPQVIGVRPLDPASVGALPPLLEGTSAEFVAGIGVLDAHLLVVLKSWRILPASIWEGLESGGVDA